MSRTLRMLAALGAVAAAQLVSALPAHADATYPDDHVFWRNFTAVGWASSENGVDEVSQQMVVEASHAPAGGSPATGAFKTTFDSLQFSIGPSTFKNTMGTNTIRVGGYSGIQTSGQFGTAWTGSQISGSDRGAVFSVWGGSAWIRSNVATHCGSWTDGPEGGWGTTCRIPLAWTENTPVTIRVWRVTSSATGAQFPGSTAPAVSGSIFEASATTGGATLSIGQIFVPNGGTKGLTNVMNFIEHSGEDPKGVPDTGCNPSSSDSYYDRVVFSPPVYKVGSTTKTSSSWPAQNDAAAMLNKNCKRQTINANGSVAVVTGKLTYADEPWPNSATNRRASGQLISSTGAGTATATVGGTISIPGFSGLGQVRVRSYPSNTILTTQYSTTSTTFNLTYNGTSTPAADTAVCVDGNADGHWKQLGRCIDKGGYPWATGAISTISGGVGAFTVSGYVDIAGFNNAAQIRPRIDGNTPPNLTAYANTYNGFVGHPWGFKWTITVPKGPHTVCMEANSNGTWTVLGNCVNVTAG